MTAYDIRVMNPETAPIEHFPLNASETFEVGEFVTLNTDGEVAEAADESDERSYIGVAAGSGDTTATATSVTGIGGFRYTSLGDFAPGDAVLQTGDLIPVYLAVPQTKFRTRNFATDGAGTDAAPTTANAQGEDVEKFVVAGVHGVDAGGADGTTDIAIVTNVLDATGAPIELSGGTGVEVVFRCIASRINAHDVA